MDVHWKQELIVLDAKVDEITTQIALLELRRTDLQRTRDRLAAAHAYWLAVPNELLGQIFCAGTEIDKPGRFLIPGANNAQAIASRRFPYTIQQVCREWRDVARSTPELWANIYVGRPLYDFEARRNAAGELVEARPYNELEETQYCQDHLETETTRAHQQLRESTIWFERSKKCPLNVYIVNPVQTPSILGRALGLLQAHLHRVHHLTIALPELSLSSYIDLYADEFLKSAPKLESLRAAWSLNLIRVYRLYEDIVEGEDPVWSLNVPSLRKLQLDNIPLESFASIAQNLTHIDFHQHDWITMRSIFRTLEACPNLRDLWVCCAPEEWRNADLYSGPVVTLPSLTTAAIHFNELAHLMYMFRFLNTPSLTRLKLKCESTRSIRNKEIIPYEQYTLAHGLPQLRMLQWQCPTFGTNSLERGMLSALLHAAPSIANVIILGMHSLVPLDVLTSINGPFKTAPNLQRLELVEASVDRSRIKSTLLDRQSLNLPNLKDLSLVGCRNVGGTNAVEKWINQDGPLVDRVCCRKSLSNEIALRHC